MYSLPTGLAVSDSYKIVVLELFLIEYTISRGLGNACNTFRMLVLMQIIPCA
jgi:hypothetical protein